MDVIEKTRIAGSLKPEQKAKFKWFNRDKSKELDLTASPYTTKQVFDPELDAEVRAFIEESRNDGK